MDGGARILLIDETLDAATPFRGQPRSAASLPELLAHRTVGGTNHANSLFGGLRAWPTPWPPSH